MTNLPESIDLRVEALTAELGVIAALKVCPSKEATKVLRDLTKYTDSLSVNLRKDLINYDKLLVSSND